MQYLQNDTQKMKNLKTLCLIGLILFVISYIFFAQGSLSTQKHIDLAHWFNLIGAVFLFTFNFVFPKNKVNLIASILTAIGVVAQSGYKRCPPRQPRA